MYYIEDQLFSGAAVEVTAIFLQRDVVCHLETGKVYLMVALYKTSG